MNAASGSRASTLMSIHSSPPLDEVEILYSCVVGIPFKIDEMRLITLRSWYQIIWDLVGQESVGSGVVTLILGQVSVKLTFWEDLGYPLILLLRNYSLGQVQECVNLTPMHGDWSSLCKFCGGKCLKGIILSLWTSSSSTTNPYKLTNPLAFLNSQPGVKIVD